MSAKFTPGNWIVGYGLGVSGCRAAGSSKDTAQIVSAGGKLVCSFPVHTPTEQDLLDIRADAQLIAAAPALLEEHRQDDVLLMQMATVLYREDIADLLPFGLLDKVKERVRRGTPAIDKAEGRS